MCVHRHLFLEFKQFMTEVDGNKLSPKEKQRSADRLKLWRRVPMSEVGAIGRCPSACVPVRNA